MIPFLSHGLPIICLNFSRRGNQLRPGEVANPQIDPVEKQTGFSQKDRTKIQELMKPYVYGKNLTRSLSEAKFHNYRGQLVFENFLNTDLQSPHRPIGVCQELSNDFKNRLEKEFPGYHFATVVGNSPQYFPLGGGGVICLF